MKFSGRLVTGSARPPPASLRSRKLLQSEDRIFRHSSRFALIAGEGARVPSNTLRNALPLDAAFFGCVNLGSRQAFVKQITFHVVEKEILRVGI